MRRLARPPSHRANPQDQIFGNDESFRLGAEKSDHLGPLIGFFGDEPSEVGRRARQRDAAQVGNPLLQLGISKTRVDFPVELVDDFGGRVPGCAGAEPGARLVARHEFGNGREVRQRLRARCGRHRERAQCARALMYSIVDAVVPKVTCTCPLSMSVIPAATLRYGTCTIFTPVIILNNSPKTWGVLPLPGDAMLSLPGLALA